MLYSPVIVAAEAAAVAVLLLSFTWFVYGEYGVRSDST